MNSPLFGATLLKTTSTTTAWEVGGVASSFYQDLDGDAIHPSAVAAAIPAFMAQRGIDGLAGGPLRLHHNFWQPLIQRAIALLSLDAQQQMDLVAAIALPLGRVTDIRVDEQGTCHWRGILSPANPVAKTIWQMLQEGLVPLGVSVGGKILATQPGRDRLGRACNLITKIRLDELSITDNPALRLVNGEAPGNGAYITALAKSLGATMTLTNSTQVEQWLQKALGGSAQQQLSPGGDPIKTGMGRGLNAPSSLRPRGGGAVKMDGAQPATGIGDRQPKGGYPQATSKGPNTDVWGMTVGELTQALEKCCDMGKAELSSPETLGLLTDASYGLAGGAEAPPDALVNFVRYLQYFSRFAQELPHMNDYQAAGTVAAMGPELRKALSDFKEGITTELSGSPLRPPGSPGVASPVIMFPSQYVQY